jgi:hypothetical protein
MSLVSSTPGMKQQQKIHDKKGTTTGRSLASKAKTKQITQKTHLDDLIDELGVQYTGNEAGADALDLVGAGLAARQHRRLGGLDGHNLRGGARAAE